MEPRVTAGLAGAQGLDLRRGLLLFLYFISIPIGAFGDAYGVCGVRGDGAQYFRQP